MAKRVLGCESEEWEKEGMGVRPTRNGKLGKIVAFLRRRETLAPS